MVFFQFGDSQKLRLVRILRSSVMVRVGGGWEPLDKFLEKNDPCRGSYPSLSYTKPLRPLPYLIPNPFSTLLPLPYLIPNPFSTLLPLPYLIPNPFSTLLPLPYLIPNPFSTLLPLPYLIPNPFSILLPFLSYT